MKSYGRLSTLFYDSDKPHPPPDALDFYLKYARTANGTILEPMCGSGRFLIPLIQQGFNLTGTDASPDMLNACRVKAKQLGIEPVLYQQYLQQLDLPESYQLVIIPAGSFCLITEMAVARESLRKIYDHLAPGGTFIVEIDQRLYHQVDQTEDNVDNKAGRTVIAPDGAQGGMRGTGHFDPLENLYQGVNRYDLIKDGEVIETEWESFNLRYYDPQLFEKLLAESGFRDIRHHSAYDENYPEEKSESLVFIARRPKDHHL